MVSRVKKIVLGGVLFAAAALAFAADPTAAELLAKVDANEVYDSIQYTGQMTINYQNKQYIKTFKSWAKGNNNSFIEFTDKVDAGTKYLKKDGRLYVYSPDTEQVTLISGNMLKQSMMGSDMSYEDTINNDTLTSRYDPVLSGKEQNNGREAYVLELTAKKKTESYYKRKLWIDTQNGDVLSYELYALSGSKLKVYTLKRAEVIGSRRFPVEGMIQDLLRKGSSTTFLMQNVVLDKPIDDAVFSMNNLQSGN